MDITNPDHIEYLASHKNVVCLQPHYIPISSALWNTKWGAVTLDRAIELESLNVSNTSQQPLTYWNDVSAILCIANENFIDTHGCSMLLD